MNTLEQKRKRFMLIAVVLVVVNVAAAAFLISPLGQSKLQRMAERDRVRQQLQVTKTEVEPLANMDKKIEQSKADANRFFEERLPQRYSQIADELGRLAREHNVQLSQVTYNNVDAQVPGMDPVAIDAQLSGDYPRVVRFLNALERNKTFFILNRVALSGERQQGAVQLQLSLETYLKG